MATLPTRVKYTFYRINKGESLMKSDNIVADMADQNRSVRTLSFLILMNICALIEDRTNSESVLSLFLLSGR